VRARREAGAAEEWAALSTSSDHRPLSTLRTNLDGLVAAPNYGYVGVVKKFDYEGGHPDRRGDDRDLAACPGEYHVEETAFLCW